MSLLLNLKAFAKKKKRKQSIEYGDIKQNGKNNLQTTYLRKDEYPENNRNLKNSTTKNNQSSWKMGKMGKKGLHREFPKSIF